jgi:hypothetical protein
MIKKLNFAICLTGKHSGATYLPGDEDKLNAAIEAGAKVDVEKLADLGRLTLAPKPKRKAPAKRKATEKVATEPPAEEASE